MKASKVRRKTINRQLAELVDLGAHPRPARQYRIVPTFGNGPATDIVCRRMVNVQWAKRGRFLGWMRKPLGKPVLCGTAIELVPGKKLLRCPSCYREQKRNRRERLQLNPPAYGATALKHMLFATALGLGRMFKRQAR